MVAKLGYQLRTDPPLSVTRTCQPNLTPLKYDSPFRSTPYQNEASYATGTATSALFRTLHPSSCFPPGLMSTS